MGSTRIMIAFVFLALAVSCSGTVVPRGGGAPDVPSDVRFEIFGMD